jgi:phosphoglycolate phosphatase
MLMKSIPDGETRSMSQPELQTEAIVWDLDGTLVDSAPDLTTALNTLLNEQGQHGHPVASVRTMIGGGVAKLIERAYRAAGNPIDPDSSNSLLPRFMEIYSACATDNTKLIPRAREVLSHFYHAGFRQGLCTNKPYAVTKQILNALDIAGFFNSIVGGDSTSHKKPHPLPLQTCLEELEASPGAAVMIGDSEVDVGAARAAGVPIILVPDGYTGVPAGLLGADYVLGSLVELPGSIMPHRLDAGCSTTHRLQ